jgi:type III restriction enzyme
MAHEALADPVLNGPYDPPTEHFELGADGSPTGAVRPGRRPSESFIPVPASTKSRRKAPVQEAFDLTTEGERRELNTLINDVRRQVELWRNRGYPGATAISRKLMQFWADPERENRVLFCQREAAETAIYLAEVAGRRGEPDFRSRVDPQNVRHNDGLPRVGLKMATGTGKTVVMAMLIAWQTLNKVHVPNDARFTKRFVVVSPGITIRDRLRVLLPSDGENYYKVRDLVPADLWGGLAEAQVLIVNYHQFLLRDRREIQGVARNTRLLLSAGRKADPFRETPDEMAARVMRDFVGRGKGEVVVLNDEAHHCYQDKPLIDEADTDAEAAERNADARVWFKGLQAIRRKVGIKTVYDLSATPFYLKGSGYNEGFIFPWVLSDFSLMDAIESGIVKIPRLPVDDDSTGATLLYRDLWQSVGPRLPKRRAQRDATTGEWPIPETLEGALHSLYRSYAKAFADWEQRLAVHGEPPPVFIVVCPNTVVSKLMYEWIAGADVELPGNGDTRRRPGHLGLLSNVVDGEWIARPRTILVDSAQLESGEALKADFKEAAAREIETFKREMRDRDPSADVEAITDEDLLREVMNTVGKPGRLGEDVRCVVSVSMLTEGWDANTVTHIIGVRAFRSRLLCEQVVGRALRRRSYAVNDGGRFDAEYASVYGVPFDFIPSKLHAAGAKPRVPAIEVRALPERAEYRIGFPRVDGYRVEIPDAAFHADFTTDSHLHVDLRTVATWTQAQGIVGADEEHELDRFRHARVQEVAYAIADRLVQRYNVHDDAPRPWLFPRLVEITKQWIDGYVTFGENCTVGLLLLAEGRAKAAELVFAAIVRHEGSRREILQPFFLGDPEGSTDRVSFFTRKAVEPAVKSHVNFVTLDGRGGNTWEQQLAGYLEQRPDVAAYVKNDHLGFHIPYLHGGVRHEFVPDFLVRLHPHDGDELVRTLIVEVSGSRKDQATREAKAAAARNQWCVAVNNHGGLGRWGFVEITEMTHAPHVLANAIKNLYAE